MLIDDYYFSLKLEGETCALQDDDPSYYSYSTSGTIVASDEYENTTLAGRFHLYYLDLGAALNAGFPIFDIFDYRADTLDYYQEIFEPSTEDLSAKLQSLFKESFGWGNVLILNRLELLPDFRGRNLGLMVMRRLIERFAAGAHVVAIKPFPLQFGQSKSNEDGWESKLQLSDLDKDRRHATAKLRRHYARLGFKAMKGTPFMFRLADDPLPPLSGLQK